MCENRTALFVSLPRTAEDLKHPDPEAVPRSFMIVKTIHLSKIEYDNFCGDMMVERSFIEENAELCETGSIWKCLLVQQIGRNDGILLIPIDGSFVKHAAYIESL